MDGKWKHDPEGNTVGDGFGSLNNQLVLDEETVARSAYSALLFFANSSRSQPRDTPGATYRWK